MNVSEYLIKYIEHQEVKHVFMLSGGGAMYLNDALGHSTKIKYVCNYHEQASAVCADAYARLSGFGVAMVTFGPGAVNALSGAVGAWYDSVPMLVICGQVRSDLIADYSKVRQLGPQEGDVLSMAKPVVKYAVQLNDVRTIKYELDKAVWSSKSGRPGPVWVEVPLDIQSAEIDLENQVEFIPPTPIQSLGRDDFLKDLVSALKASHRPVLLAGNGFRLSQTQKELEMLVDTLNIPVLVPYTARSVIGEYNSNFAGVFGTAGRRSSNIILQNSDLIISLGVGLSVAKTGFAVDKLAPNARKIVVDIEEGQIVSHPLKPDSYLVDDLRQFMPDFNKAVKSWKSIHSDWLELSDVWRRRYPVFENVKLDADYVDVYRFIEMLSSEMAEGEVVVGGNGLDCVSVYQGFKLKRDQEIIINGNWGSMGWELPQSIGAHYATGNRVVCVAGDGSILLNSQELLLIGKKELPITIFLYNNSGYGSIKATQNSLFEGHIVGADKTSGVDNPNFKMLASAYGLEYTLINNDVELVDALPRLMKSATKPRLVELNVSTKQWISPKATAFRNEKGKLESKPLDDMAPFLTSEEVERNRTLAFAVFHKEPL